MDIKYKKIHMWIIILFDFGSSFYQDGAKSIKSQVLEI